MKRIYIILCFFIVAYGREDIYSKNTYDVSLIGPIKFADGLGRAIIGFAQHLHQELAINIIQTYGSFEEVPEVVRDLATKTNKTPGTVALLFDMLCNQWRCPTDSMPNSKVKIAYSMIESTAIPFKWMQLLNTRFDAVAVPDDAIAKVYKQCGVKIPIFVVPCGIYLDEFLAVPDTIKTKHQNKKFIFGMSGGFFGGHKNHELLIDAFWQEFSNNPNVALYLHGRKGDSALERRVLQKIRKLKARNIIFINRDLTSQDYLAFMKSLDCYVLLSKGEGFSITPREALALGIPVIISRNSAHETICATGYVKAVESPIKESFYFAAFGGPCGYCFGPTLLDTRQALRQVYDNYAFYKSKALLGREWVKQYRYQEIKELYKTLVKPKNIVLGNANAISDGTLTTNSKSLYEKYRLAYDHL